MVRKHPESEADPAFALRNIAYLNAVLTRLTRRQIAELIAVELAGGRRKPILKRLHQRLCRLRAYEEYAELRQARHAPVWVKREAHL